MKTQSIEAIAPSFGTFACFIPASNPLIQETLNQLKDAQTISPKLDYDVEHCEITDSVINVDFALNDKASSITISMTALRLFVISSGLNDYCFDSSVNGEHVQDSGTVEPDTFITENLYEAVEAYLRYKRIGQNVN